MNIARINYVGRQNSLVNISKPNLRLVRNNDLKISNSINLLSNYPNYKLPKITFRGTPYLPKADIEIINKDNTDVILPLYKKYQEGMNQTVDEEKLKKYVNRMIEKDDKMFVIKEEGKPAGFIHFSDSYSTIDMTPFATIQSVYMLPEYRGRGISKTLINELKEWVRCSNYKGIFVKTLAKNEVSCGMYRKQGFKDEINKYGIFFWPNEEILDYSKGYVNTKKDR